MQLDQNIKINLTNGDEVENKLEKLCTLAQQLNEELEKANLLISKLTSLND